MHFGLARPTARQIEKASSLFYRMSGMDSWRSQRRGGCWRGARRPAPPGRGLRAKQPGQRSAFAQQQAAKQLRLRLGYSVVTSCCAEQQPGLHHLRQKRGNGARLGCVQYRYCSAGLRLRLMPWLIESASRKVASRLAIAPASPQCGRKAKVFRPSDARSLFSARTFAQM
eukprot:COSAG04_NODE_1078_length_8422_cov_5.090833_12_plen_170_part_00